MIKRFSSTYLYKNRIVSRPSYYGCNTILCKMTSNCHFIPLPNNKSMWVSNDSFVDHIFNRIDNNDNLEELFLSPRLHIDCNDLRFIVDHIEYRRNSKAMELLSAHVRYTVEHKDCVFCHRYHDILNEINKKAKFL